MPYSIKGDKIIKTSTGETVGRSKNPKKYLHVLQAIEHGWRPKNKMQKRKK